MSQMEADHHTADERSALLGAERQSSTNAPSRSSKRRRRISIWAPVLLTLLFALVACIFVVPTYLAGLAQLVDYDIDGVSGVYPALDGIHGTLQANYRVQAEKSWLMRRILARAPFQLTEVQADVLWPEDRETKVAKLVAEPFTIQPGQKHYAQDLTIVGIGHVLDTVKAAKLSRALWAGDGPDVVPLRVVARIGGMLPFTFKVHMLLDVRIARQLEVPQPTIRLLTVEERSEGGFAVGLELEARAPLSVSSSLPATAWEVYIDGCDAVRHDKASLAELTVAPTTVHCRKDELCAVVSNVTMGRLATTAQRRCSSGSSPLEIFARNALGEKSSHVYIGGAKKQEAMPDWATDLLRQLVLPVELPAQSFQIPDLQELALSNVTVHVENEASSSKLASASGGVSVIVPMPWPVSFHQLIATVGGAIELMHRGQSFARIGLNDATASVRSAHARAVVAKAVVADTAVSITNYDVFAAALQSLLRGNTSFEARGRASIDSDTPLGHIQLSELPLPAVPVNVPHMGLPGQIPAKINGIDVVSSTETLLLLKVDGTIKSPLPHSVDLDERVQALVDYDDIEVGQLSVDRLCLRQQESPLTAFIAFNRTTDAQKEAGAKMLGQYLSGDQTLVTLRAYEDSMPSRPELARALAAVPIEITLPLPQMELPTDDGDDADSQSMAVEKSDNDKDKPHHSGSPFLVKSSFHFFTSTASFVLRNPLNESVLIDRLSAVASYRGGPVGTLEFDASLLGEKPIVLAGDAPTTETPRLPVRWSARGIGRDALRAALGGTLTLNATAEATVRVARFGPIELNLTATDVGAGVGF